jgi:nucleoside-diphosphate-sugar epimerase
MEVSNYKIKQQMEWQPSITLEEGLRRYYEYIQKYPA